MLVNLHTFQKASLQVWIENRIFLFANSAEKGSTGNTCKTQLFRKKATANWLRQCSMRYEKAELSYTLPRLDSRHAYRHTLLNDRFPFYFCSGNFIARPKTYVCNDLKSFYGGMGIPPLRGNPYYPYHEKERPSMEAWTFSRVIIEETCKCLDHGPWPTIQTSCSYNASYKKPKHSSV